MGRWRHGELADVDDIAIVRALADDRPPPLSMGERFLATIELRRRGYTYGAIGQQLGIDGHQVYRYLHRAGLTVPRSGRTA